MRGGADDLEPDYPSGERIMEGVRRAELNLKMDERTEGFGNCFPFAVWQQCRRAAVQLSSVTDHRVLRRDVCNYMMKSKHKVVLNMRNRWEASLAVALGSWRRYWHRMAIDREWVDEGFIQGIAWFLQRDILIIWSTATRKEPYISFSGNRDGSNAPCLGVPLLLGYDKGLHYQSLLPLDEEIYRPANFNPILMEQILRTLGEVISENEVQGCSKPDLSHSSEGEEGVTAPKTGNVQLRKRKLISKESEGRKKKVPLPQLTDSSEGEDEEGTVRNKRKNLRGTTSVQQRKKGPATSRSVSESEDEEETFTFNYKADKGEVEVTELKSGDVEYRCLLCLTTQKQIVSHMEKAHAECFEGELLKSFQVTLKKYAARRRQAKLRAKDPERVKEKNKRDKAQSRAKDPEGAKEKNREHNARWRAKNSVGVKAKNKSKKARSRTKQKANDLEGFKKYNREEQKRRKNELSYLKETQFGADFPCACCHTLKFKHQVWQLTKQRVQLINQKADETRLSYPVRKTHE